MESDAQPRDYNKDPIVIEDYNPLFLALFAFSAIPIIVLIYIFNPGGTSESSLSRNVFFILPVMMFPYFYGYLKARGKRKIVLTKLEIKLLHDNCPIEKIALDEISEIRKTYSDIYHISQYEGDFGKFLSIIFFPFAIIRHVILIISKFFFHLFFNCLKNYRFYDAIIIFSNDRIINILPITAIEYAEVEKYFRQFRDENIADLKTYFELSHLPEKINLDE